MVGNAAVRLGAAARPLALLAEALGRTDEADGHFDCALEIEESLGMRPYLAHAKYEYAGVLLARRGAPGRVRTLLEASLDTARALGLPMFVQAIEARQAQARTQ